MRPPPPPELDPRVKRSLVGIGVLFLGLGIFLVVAGEADATTVGPMVTIDTSTGQTHNNGGVDSDGATDLIACWNRADGATNTLRTRHSSDTGATWAASVTIFTNGGANTCGVRHATGDTWYAGGTRFTAANNDDLWLEISTDDGATWTTRDPPATSPAADLDASFDVDPTDSNRVAFFYRNETVDQVFYIESTDAGVTWGPVVLVSQAGETERDYSTTQNAATRFRFNPSGVAYGVSLASAPTDAFRVHTSSDGTTWARTEHADPNFDTQLFQIAIEPTEDCWVVSYTGGARYTTENCDGTTVVVSADEGVATATQWITANTLVTTTKIFGAVAGQNFQIWVTTDGGVTWDGPEVTGDTDTSGAQGTLALARIDTENAYIVYNDGTSLLRGGLITDFPVPPDLSVTGFVNLRDVRTDYENDPSVFVRSDTNDGSVGQIASFTKLLAGRVNRNACTTQITTGADEYGLSVTFDGRIIWSCVATASNRAVLGSTSTISTPSTQYNSFDATTGAFTTIDSLTANDVVANQRDVALWNVDLGGITSATAYTKTLTDVVHVTLDKGGLENHTWAVSDTAGTKAYSHDGLRVVNAPSITGLAIAAYNNTVYIGNATSIGRYDVAVDTLTLNGTAAGGVRIGGLRVSKDGAYLLQWQSATWTLRNSTTLAVVDSATARGTLFACDLDVRNNRVYCGSADTLFGWEVFDATGSLAGNGTAGSENPAVAQTYFDSVESSFSDTPAVPVDPATPLVDVTGLVPHFGTESKAKGFLAVFLVLSIAGGLGALPMAGTGGSFSVALGVLGGLAGFLLAYQLGLFPAWVIMFLALVLAAVGVQRFTSSRGA